ncbi:hypothetical protein ACFFWD_30060 [Bradyrhizobium erythrophlei]|uniref:hypothetical protein n=1 Tax=Bradyrhizobium erythrophlei TaxID=1437360 RepID=UPI0035EA3309
MRIAAIADVEDSPSRFGGLEYISAGIRIRECEGQSLYPENAAMLIRVLLSMLVLVLVSASADAFSTTAGDRWSDLRDERLQQLPSAVRAALLNAQKACGEERISVRSGFIRYLKNTNGSELIALHFDQFHCANRSALCTSSGCLHQIFLARRGVVHREVWHGHVQEVDLTDRGGRIFANVACDGGYCAVNRHFKIDP